MQEANSVLKDIYQERKKTLEELEKQAYSRSLRPQNQRILSSIIKELNDLVNRNSLEFAYLLAELHSENTLGCKNDSLTEKYFKLATKSVDPLIKACARNNLGTYYLNKAKEHEETGCKKFEQDIFNLKNLALKNFQKAKDYKAFKIAETLETEETANDLIEKAKKNYDELHQELEEHPKNPTSSKFKPFKNFMRECLKLNEEQQKKLIKYVNNPESISPESKDQSQQELLENNSEHSFSNIVEIKAETFESEEKSEEELPKLITETSSPPPLPSAEPPSTPEPETKKDQEEIAKPKSPKTWNFLGNSAQPPAPKPEASQKRTWNSSQSPVKKENEEKKQETEEEKTERLKKIEKENQKKLEYEASFPSLAKKR